MIKEPKSRVDVAKLYVSYSDYKRRCEELETENKRLLAIVKHENRERGESFNEWWKRYRLAVNAQSCGTISTEAARRIWDAAFELAHSEMLDTGRGS